MEATLLQPQSRFYAQGKNYSCESQFCYSRLSWNRVSVKPISSGLCRRQFCSSLNKHVLFKENKGLLLLDHFPRNSVKVWAASTESVNYEQFIDTTSGGGALDVNSSENSAILEPKPKAFRNKFLNFVRFGSIINNAAESFFKSEIRRRLFVTAVLIVISRIGYFIPLPGFDRRLMPKNYLSFVSGAVDELGDLTPELKLSLFQLGISPQIAASILMQVLCYVVPSLVKLRKEGLDGHEKIKSYMCV